MKNFKRKAAANIHSSKQKSALRSYFGAAGDVYEGLNSHQEKVKVALKQERYMYDADECPAYDSDAYGMEGGGGGGCEEDCDAPP